MTLGCIVWLQKVGYRSGEYVFSHGFFVPLPVPPLHDLDFTSLKLGQGLKPSSKAATRIIGMAAASGKNGRAHTTLKYVCNSVSDIDGIAAALLRFTGATG